MKFRLVESIVNKELYNGSKHSHKVFTRDITWLCEDREYAESFAIALNGKGFLHICTTDISNYFECGNTDGYLYEVMSILLPFRFSKDFNDLINRLNITDQEARNLIDKVKKENNIDSSIEEKRLHIFSITRSKAFRELILSKGYDSISTIEFGHKCYAVYNPKDIKVINIEEVK